MEGIKMKNKLAIVTGGTRGIGAEISIELKKNGYEVVANYSSNDQSAENFYKKTGIEVAKWDVSNYQQCLDNVQNIEQKFNRNIDILINNAGITRDTMLHKSTKQQWDEVINTNLSSCYNMSYAVIKQMRENNFGRIVSISSINALSGQMGQTNYAAAKAGIIGFSKSLALESAIKGITVNVIAPGYTETDMTNKIDPTILQAIISHIPMKRLASPEEIARGVLFLVAEEASFITGQVISINGGQYM
jgi:acetoacetyl-CoA reductase